MSEVQFIVESIVDFRGYDSDDDAVIEYKVKWKGYSDKQCTWEPRESICEDRGTRKKVHQFDKHYMERILYKIQKYSSRGFSGLEKVNQCNYRSIGERNIGKFRQRHDKMARIFPNWPTYT